MMLFMLQVIGYVCKGQFSKGDCDALRRHHFAGFGREVNGQEREQAGKG